MNRTGLRGRGLSLLVLPPIAVIAMLYAGVVRLIQLAALQRYPPNPEHLVQLGRLTAHWEFWQGDPGSTSLQGTLTTINLLLVLLLWLQLRRSRAESGRHRAVLHLAYLGPAILLACLQLAVVRTTLVEPDYDLVRLEEVDHGRWTQ